MVELELLRVGAHVLEASRTRERDREHSGAPALPGRRRGEERLAGTAVSAREEQQGRQPGGEQVGERDRAAKGVGGRERGRGGAGLEPELRRRPEVVLDGLDPGVRELLLDPVEAGEHLSVGPKQREERDGADREEGKGGHADGERENLRALEPADPRDRARVALAHPSDERERSRRRERAVPRQSLPAGRRRVQLPEAMALGRLPAGEADGDRRREEDEQAQRRGRASDGRRGEEHEYGDRELGNRQDQRQRPREPGRRAERDDRFASPFPVGELCAACDREAHREHEACREDECFEHRPGLRRRRPGGSAVRRRSSSRAGCSSCRRRTRSTSPPRRSIDPCACG